MTTRRTTAQPATADPGPRAPRKPATATRGRDKSPRAPRSDTGPTRAQNSAATQAQRRADRAEFDVSGMQRYLRTEPTMAWEDVEDHVEHVGDFAATITDTRMLSNAGMSVGMYTGSAYAMQITAAALASKRQFVYVRMYTVPRDVFMADEHDDTGNA